MRQKKVLVLLLAAICATLLAGCQGCNTVDKPETPPVAVTRLDTLLFEPGGVDSLLEHHADFATLWGNVLGYDGREPLPQLFGRFASDTLMRQLYDSINRVFPTTEAQVSQLQEAFGAIAAHLPQMTIPHIYFYNSGFNASILLADSMLGIGLDRFLGPGCWYYSQLGIPRYLARSMAPQRIAPVALQMWVESEYPLDVSRTKILDHMLYRGALLYMVRQALQGLPDSVALGYSGQQLLWLQEHERALWQYLSEKKLLYETNSLLVNQFTKPAPFTTALGQDSPGQAACYVGYRIVEAYMHRNPTAPWSDLLGAQSAQTILGGARYNP